ncbi:GNAT family N-acetyltransferase [Edaphobacter acidisoli]|uniref:GNAT family N-acetyltransferase n=1 Tax=Edaphobacter acidisoli TaxID=2040573 RepID=A0A916W583_9BACT|nr:GNAT family N-acetyltransferase [Edaphobacter acidisoli]GGA66553.1 GNAT family N-acetyltransferase [Edaphobacter acidisoli]
MAVTETEAIAASLLIRPIVAEDAKQVAELSKQLGYEISAEAVSERISRLAACKDTQVALVACINTNMVGWIEAAVTHHLQSPAHTLITGLVVRSEVRSMGVGRRLCAEVEAWSRSKGIALLRVTSRMTRERAHQFYLREGFTQTKTQAVFEKSLS